MEIRELLGVEIPVYLQKDWERAAAFAMGYLTEKGEWRKFLHVPEMMAVKVKISVEAGRYGPKNDSPIENCYIIGKFAANGRRRRKEEKKYGIDHVYEEGYCDGDRHSLGADELLARFARNPSFIPAWAWPGDLQENFDDDETDESVSG